MRRLGKFDTGNFDEIGKLAIAIRPVERRDRVEFSQDESIRAVKNWDIAIRELCKIFRRLVGHAILIALYSRDLHADAVRRGKDP